MSNWQAVAFICFGYFPGVIAGWIIAKDHSRRAVRTGGSDG